MIYGLYPQVYLEQRLSEKAEILNSIKNGYLLKDILEKMYIIFSLPGYSRNMRNEYTNTPRNYFWDNGIRNSLISNFNPISIRNDSGQLWENYCIAERQKFLSFNRIAANRFFWRTYTQQEIDYLEERDGRLFAFEMKYSGKSANVPSSFNQNYPAYKQSFSGAFQYAAFPEWPFA